MNATCRRALVMLTIAVAVLLPAAGAQAFQTGNYRGGKPFLRVTSISFKATQTRVRDLKFEIKRGPACSDGSKIADSQDGYDFSPRKVKPDGRFSGTGLFAGSTAFAVFEVRGRLISEGRARGIMRTEVTFTAGPRAGVKCDTGELRWGARRILPRRR